MKLWSQVLLPRKGWHDANTPSTISRHLFPPHVVHFTVPVDASADLENEEISITKILSYLPSKPLLTDMWTILPILSGWIVKLSTS